MTTQTYQDAAYHLLAQAEAELAAGDTRQASEKAWGAATQIVKSACERRGWRHRNYRALNRAVDRLQAESGDPELRPLFRAAFAMHVNFYEDSEIPGWVAAGLDDVRRFVEKVDGIELSEGYQ